MNEIRDIFKVLYILNVKNKEKMNVKMNEIRDFLKVLNI